LHAGGRREDNSLARRRKRVRRILSRLHRVLPGNKPARSTLQAKNMAGTKVEIEAIAYKHEAD
jgi:enamine deaminase RidA (YjgF/YER057c/UK114 family)